MMLALSYMTGPRNIIIIVWHVFFINTLKT
jgi:hypothetical protein